MNVRGVMVGLVAFLLSFWCFRSFVHNVPAPTWCWVALGIAVLYVSSLTYFLTNLVDRMHAAEKLNRQLTKEIRKTYTEQ